ncbi:MAG: hypothetical protein HY914_22625 [Desulfomonile tiedjei]|nr:hypothetical protein [Desulfomonile tiedjei]
MSSDPRPNGTLEETFRGFFGRYSLDLACAVWIAIIWLWKPAILTLTVDDSFYYLKTALNVAAGHGTTFDQINPTTGFHPLWLLALVPVAWIFGDASALLVKVVLTLQVALVYSGTRCLSRVEVSGGRYLTSVFAILLLNFYFAKVFINGQESALEYALLCWSLVYWWKRSVSPEDHRFASAAILGLLAGLTVLARLEAIFFAWALLSVPLLWPRRGSEEESLRRRLPDFFVAAGTLSAVLIPYVVWNLHFHGHLIPVSAAVKYREPSTRMLGAILLLAAVATPLCVVACRRMEAAWVSIPRRVFDRVRFLLPLGCHVMLVTLLEATFLGKIAPAIWYFPPHLLLVALIVSIAWAQAPQRRAAVAAAWISLAAVLAFAGVTWLYRLDPLSYEAYMQAKRRGDWLRHNTAEDALAAGWDCGITAFFSHRRFINLDGLISSWEYKKHYLDKNQTGRFITEVHPVEYIAQHFPPEFLRYGGRLGGLDLFKLSVVYAEVGDVRLMKHPLRVRKLYSVVLSRTPRTGAVTFDELASKEVPFRGTSVPE